MVGTSSIVSPLSRAPWRHLPPVVENSNFVDRAASGETIVISKRNEPVAELRPVSPRRTARVFGNPAAGVEIPDSFFDPLPDDLLAAFGAQEPK
jgi:prevent-host-death family protein